MADIFVYHKNCVDFDNLGECGPLDCLNAKFTEEANGGSKLVIEHPIDDIGRWSYLIEDYILQAEVPVRTTPEIKDGTFVTTVQTWRVKSTASKRDRGLYSKKSGGKRLSTIPIWDDKAKTKQHTVCVVDMDDSTMYKVKRKKGYGWVKQAAIEYVLTPPDLEDSAAAIELVVPAWSIRPQLFRMHKPKVTHEKVIAEAYHISYDLLGNSTTYDPERTHPAWSSAKEYLLGDIVSRGGLIYFCSTPNINVAPPNASYWTDNPTCGAALAGVLRKCIKPHEFEGRTNVADQRVINDWIDVSPMSALLDPDTGIVPLWGVDLIRDNWEINILDDAGINRGVRIEYEKNLTGVECELDQSNLITSIKPIGQTSKGRPLYLTPGTYTVDGITVIVDESLTVNSEHENDYPIPHVYTLDLGKEAKATGTSRGHVLAARNKMVKACLDMFKTQKCDIPLLTLKVEFISLGSTIEYQQFAQLENVYLFDRVTVWHPKLGIDVLSSVKRIEYDPVKEQFVSIEVGPVRRDADRKKTPSWELPPVQQVAYGAVQAGGLAENAVNSDNIDVKEMTSQGTVEWAAGLVSDIISEKSVVNGTPVDLDTVPSIRTSLLSAMTAHVDNLVSGNVTADTLYAALATLAVAQITTANITTANIEWAEIQTLMVEVADIAVAQITTANIESANINWAQITALTARMAEIVTANITTANIESANIDWASIETLVAKMAAVTDAHISEAVIDGAQIADASITDAKIADLSASKITAGVINASNIEVVNLNAANITVGKINGQQIAPGAIDVSHIANGAITGDKIDLGAISANKLNLTQHVIY